MYNGCLDLAKFLTETGFNLWFQQNSRIVSMKGVGHLGQNTLVQLRKKLRMYQLAVLV